MLIKLFQIFITIGLVALILGCNNGNESYFEVGDKVPSAYVNKALNSKKVTVCNEGIKCYTGGGFAVNMSGDTMEIDLNGELIVVHNVSCTKEDNSKTEADIDIFCQSTDFEEGQRIGWWQISIASK